MNSEPEKLIPLHGGYRKLKSFRVAQLAISESVTPVLGRGTAAAASALSLA